VTLDNTVVSQSTPEAILIIEKGYPVDERYTLSNKPTVIGRDSEAHIVLTKDAECSRQHAHIISVAGQFAIEDLSSTNGTFVNESRITTSTLLNSNDKIRIGETIFHFQLFETLVEDAAPTQGPSTLEPAVAPTQSPSTPEPVVDANIVPSRLVLTQASETNKRLGHENLGFLSEEHGFMPTSPPLLELPPMYKAWDDIAENMPELVRTLSLRRTFDSLPVLNVSEANLPDKYLLRASALLSIFGYAYYRIQPEPPDKIADSIMQPWVLSYIDLIIYNWKLINPMLDDPIRVENMELLIPTVDNVVERIFYLGQVEILSQLTPAVGAIVRRGS
jgi:sulfite reductase (NADPH) flavoprotein alpha-component